MTELTDFYYKPCEKLDANCVDAYTELAYGLQDYEIKLDTSWGESVLDMRPVVKSSETITTLELSPSDNPVSLQYTKEDGTVDCIEGDDLSHIISMTKLKDVSQATQPTEGDIYIYRDGKFIPFNLDQFITTNSANITDLQRRVQVLEQRADLQQIDINTNASNIATNTTNIATNADNIATNTENISSNTNRIVAIETTLTKPANVPANVGVAWGNINLYGDSANTGSKTSGIYTHDPNNNVTNDQRFA